MFALLVDSLRKRFGETVALDGVSLSVREGEIYCVVGPNGSGKTTLLRIVSTLLLPDSGTVKVFQYDVVKDAHRVREIIAYLPEEAGAYRYLTGVEYLKLMARLYARKEPEEAVVKRAAEISQLGDRLRDRISTYSRGMLRRLLTARVLSVRPKLAILDEPTTGVDVIHSAHIREAIRKYAREEKTTVLMSSHDMFEVQSLCDRVAFLNRGRLVAEGTPKELMGRYNAENIGQVFLKCAYV
ncbi:MAG: ABC transporter ATP-binding protein [Pyrobaculum sp.]